MEKVKKLKKYFWIFLIVFVVLCVVLNIYVPFIDIHTDEVEIYAPPLQLFGIEYRSETSDSDENVPKDVYKIYVPIKDYFKAKEAISRSHALMAMIDQELYTVAKELGLGRGL